MFLIKTKRDNLLSPLQAVSGIVEKKHTLAILANVLLEKKKNKIVFLATDTDIQITTSVEDVNEESEEAITVNSRKLQDILRSLPEAAEVTINLENKKLIIKAGKSRFTLQTLPAENFPKLLITDSEIKLFSISQKNLKKLLNQTQFSMATQDVRYYLNGLLLIFDGSELKAVSTDGHRLAYSALNFENEIALKREELILPRKTVLELSRLLADTDEMVNIRVGSNQISFQFSNIELVSKMIDGKFPDYNRVIPSNIQNTVQLNRLALYQSLTRAAILTNEKFKCIRILLGNGLLKIIAANSEQEEANEELEINYHKELIDVGFNVNYLLDLLNNTTSEIIDWGFTDSSSSALFSVKGDLQFKYVVMPMRI